MSLGAVSLTAPPERVNCAGCPVDTFFDFCEDKRNHRRARIGERSETIFTLPQFSWRCSLRTYIPTSVIEVHKLARFVARYQSVLRPAIVAVDPAYGAIFDSLMSALLAFDAVAATLYPLEE